MPPKINIPTNAEHFYHDFANGIAATPPVDIHKQAGINIRDYTYFDYENWGHRYVPVGEPDPWGYQNYEQVPAGMLMDGGDHVYMQYPENSYNKQLRFALTLDDAVQEEVPWTPEQVMRLFFSTRASYSRARFRLGRFNLIETSGAGGFYFNIPPAQLAELFWENGEGFESPLIQSYIVGGAMMQAKASSAFFIDHEAYVPSYDGGWTLMFPQLYIPGSELVALPSDGEYTVVVVSVLNWRYSPNFVQAFAGNGSMSFLGYEIVLFYTDPYALMDLSMSFHNTLNVNVEATSSAGGWLSNLNIEGIPVSEEPDPSWFQPSPIAPSSNYRFSEQALRVPNIRGSLFLGFPFDTLQVLDERENFLFEPYPKLYELEYGAGYGGGWAVGRIGY